VVSTEYQTSFAVTGAFAHSQLGMTVIVPASGVKGDLRPNTAVGESRAWSPPV
jgi:hypothetical protein